MKICVIGLEIIPSENGVFLGGSVNTVARLAKGLSRRGHKIVILTSDVNNTCQGRLDMEWAEICPIRIQGQYASLRSGMEFLLKAIPWILKEHRQHKFDIFHFHSAYPIFGIISFLSRTLVRAPTVFTLYSPIQPQPLRDRKGLYQHLPLPFITRLFLSGSKLIAVSQNVKRSLVSTGFEETDIALLPPCIDTSLFNPDLDRHQGRKKLGVPSEMPFILYCGSWAGWKGIDVLIESMPYVVREFPEIKLCAAWGEAYDWYDERKKIIKQKIEDLGLQQNIIEVGIVKDIHNLMASAGVFVAPLLNTDGVADYPLSILEAMACATPVIASSVGGIPEVIKHGQNGLLVPPGDPLELANAIRYVLTNKEKTQEMAKRGAEFVSADFGLDSAAEKLEKIYCAIIGAKWPL